MPHRPSYRPDPYHIYLVALLPIAYCLLLPISLLPARNLTVVGIALAISGVAFAGQQVAGVVDAMHAAV